MREKKQWFYGNLRYSSTVVLNGCFIAAVLNILQYINRNRGDSI